MLRWLTEVRHSEIYVLGWIFTLAVIDEIGPWYVRIGVGLILILLFDALDRWLYRRAWGKPRPDV